MQINYNCVAPITGFLVAKGLQYLIERSFPPVDQENAYAPEQLGADLRRKVRMIYDEMFNWHRRSQLYTIIGSTFPLTVFALIVVKQNAPELLQSTFFILNIPTFIGNIHAVQRVVFICIRILTFPFPSPIKKVMVACLYFIEPAKVIFPDGQADFYYAPENHQHPSLDPTRDPRIIAGMKGKLDYLRSFLRDPQVP
jgi:hypothetical protein